MFVNLYQRGDTLDQAKFKVVEFVFGEYSKFLNKTKATQETARELSIDYKTVERILSKGSENEEVDTSIGEQKEVIADEVGSKKGRGNSRKAS